MIDIQQLKRVIHLTPARQNQVCYRVEITPQAQRAVVNIYPTLELYDQGRTTGVKNEVLYRSMLFHAGMAQANIEEWCNQQGLSYTVETNVQEHARSHQNLGWWIQTQRDVLLGFIAVWINDQLDTNALFEDYTYDMNKCVRDFTHLIYAISEDLSFGTHATTAGIANMFWDENGQPVSRRPQELAIHGAVRSKLAELSATQPPVWRTQLLSLYDLFIDILDKGARPELEGNGLSYTDFIRITINA